MKDSIKDQVEGKVHEVMGAVKEKVGQATNGRGPDGRRNRRREDRRKGSEEGHDIEKVPRKVATLASSEKNTNVIAN